MKDELQDLRDAGYRPTVVGPHPFSLDALLLNADLARRWHNVSTNAPERRASNC